MVPELFAPEIIATGFNERDITVSPDGNEFYLTCENKVIFTKQANNVWTDPIELKLGMDAGQPFVTNDWKYLFFSTGNPRVGSDIYWVDARIIEGLRPDVLK